MLRVPDTALAKSATALAASCSPAPLLNHCHRTYLFGGALLSRAGRDFDEEALYIASMLHDLGLTSIYEDGITPFEQRGAEVAADALREAGAPTALADLVHEAIALHLKVSTAEHERPEVAGVSIGAAVDVLGLRLDDVPESVVAQALETHPRLGFKEYLIHTIDKQVQLKPSSRIADYVVRHRFNDLVAATPFTE